METISNSLRLNKLSIHHRSSNTNISLWISEELLPLKKKNVSKVVKEKKRRSLKYPGVNRSRAVQHQKPVIHDTVEFCIK